jgi:hypothetical protein
MARSSESYAEKPVILEDALDLVGETLKGKSMKDRRMVKKNDGGVARKEEEKVGLDLKWYK